MKGILPLGAAKQAPDSCLWRVFFLENQKKLPFTQSTFWQPQLLKSALRKAHRAFYSGCSVGMDGLYACVYQVQQYQQCQRDGHDNAKKFLVIAFVNRLDALLFL